MPKEECLAACVCLGPPFSSLLSFTLWHLSHDPPCPLVCRALPVLASLERPQPAASPPSPPSPLRQAEVPSPSSSSTLDALSWSSDEEAEEDRSARKRDMAAALRQLKSFKAGGDPARPTRPAPAVLQRSFTDPSAYQVVKRAPSPMRTLWRQASAAAATLEGAPSTLPAREAWKCHSSFGFCDCPHYAPSRVPFESIGL